MPAPFSESFSERYARGDLSPFFNLEPHNTRAALDLPRAANRDALTKALRRYAEKLGAPKATFTSLDALAQPESRAVVTGQQVGLLLGPLYTLSKAVTALNLANQLSTEEKPVVPIFWLASQDGDSAEIDHAYVLDLAEELHKLQLPLPPDVPAGRIGLGAPWVEQITTSLKNLNAHEAYLDEVLDLITHASEHAETFADWFAALLYDLLGDQGLIIINPLEPDIAPLFRSVLEAELENPRASSLAINEAGERLRELGFAPQLGRGEEATNLFLEEDGKRQLLRFDAPEFYTENETYTLDELQAVLKEEPSRLTPAAGLRPITQDAALPTAATVVGPGELRYFAQLKGVYGLHNVAMPLAWPRMEATVLEPPVRRILEKYKLSAGEVQADFNHIYDQILLNLQGHGERFEETLSELESLAKDLTEHVAAVDPTLERTVERGEEHMRKTVELLRFKSSRALRRQDTITTQQFERLKAHLLPTDKPQERVLSPFSFFLKFGVKNVVEAFLKLPPEGSHEVKF